LSHELRTPLTPILLATATWKDIPTVPEALRHALAMIHRNATTEARLVDDLLDLTRITQGKLTLQPDVVDIAALAADAAESLATEIATAGQTLALELRSRRRVTGDPVRLQQVVTNLLRNAIRFTPAGGRITLATRDAGDRTTLTVTDTGEGFEPELLATMFEPFEQGVRSAAEGGLGLGLAITKGLVEAHGGTITATSAGPDRGARFAVTFPSSKPSPKTIRADAAPRADVPPLRILLVEDHDDTSMALSYILEHEGYDVQRAHSVADALRAAETMDVDMIVSDLGLPDGSGLDLMRTLKARKPVRGIALTGYGRREDIARTREAGFDRHLTKPVDLPTLLATIASLRSDAA
jgi:CheY-like chemotaxis protein